MAAPRSDTHDEAAEALSAAYALLVEISRRPRPDEPPASHDGPAEDDGADEAAA